MFNLKTITQSMAPYHTLSLITAMLCMILTGNNAHKNTNITNDTGFEMDTHGCPQSLDANTTIKYHERLIHN